MVAQFNHVADDYLDLLRKTLALVFFYLLAELSSFFMKLYPDNCHLMRQPNIS